MTNQGIAVREISDGLDSIRELEDRFAIAVRQRELLEKYITERLTPGKHFYKVQGSKNSLTKEGAELICLPHGYKPAYTFDAGPSQPPEDDTPYQLTVTCRLMKGESFAGEGMGSASSHITTKEEGRKPRQPDIGLRHNATLKMAQKSAYIAATLNATAASEFFTQDIEDGAEVVASKNALNDNRFYCAEHKQTWTKRTSQDKKTSWYSHKQGDGWCNMKDARLDAKDNQDQPILEKGGSNPDSAPPQGGTQGPPEPERHAGKDITAAEWQSLYDWCAEKWGIEKPDGVHLILGKARADWTGTLRQAASLIQAAKEQAAKESYLIQVTKEQAKAG